MAEKTALDAFYDELEKQRAALVEERQAIVRHVNQLQGRLTQIDGLIAKMDELLKTGAPRKRRGRRPAEPATE